VRIVDPARGDGLLTEHLGPHTRRVLIVFLHGVGDVVMFLAPFNAIRQRYPGIHFDLGLARGLGEENVCPDAILLESDWPSWIGHMQYDLVFRCNFPMEDVSRPFVTKAELCCEQELGIPPVCGHPRLTTKRLVAVHFHSTAVPQLANAPADVARRIWDDILAAGYVPVETHFEHVFHNPDNARFEFTDQHVRHWAPRLDTLMALLGAAEAFVGVVSGNFHLALSILGPSRVMLLERGLKATQFTKARIVTGSLNDYRGEVRRWLTQRPWTNVS
jgi:hypothetical protein